MADHVCTFVDGRPGKVPCLVNGHSYVLGRYEIGMQEAIGCNLNGPGSATGGRHPLRIPQSRGVEAAAPARAGPRVSWTGSQLAVELSTVCSARIHTQGRCGSQEGATASWRPTMAS